MSLTAIIIAVVCIIAAEILLERWRERRSPPSEEKINAFSNVLCSIRERLKDASDDGMQGAERWSSVCRRRVVVMRYGRNVGDCYFWQVFDTEDPDHLPTEDGRIRPPLAQGDSASWPEAYATMLIAYWKGKA